MESTSSFKFPILPFRVLSRIRCDTEDEADDSGV